MRRACSDRRSFHIEAHQFNCASFSIPEQAAITQRYRCILKDQEARGRVLNFLANLLRRIRRYQEQVHVLARTSVDKGVVESPPPHRHQQIQIG